MNSQPSLIDVISDNMQYWINKYPSASIILGGDFNMVLNSDLDRFPSRTSCVSPIMDAFITRFTVVDIWRVTYPQQRLYTWSSKDHSKQSRIDYWLISQSLANSCDSVESASMLHLLQTTVLSLLRLVFQRPLISNQLLLIGN